MTGLEDVDSFSSVSSFLKLVFQVRFMGFHVFLAVDVGFKRFLAVGTHEGSFLLMSGHVPPDTACSGEHHITLSTLIHLGAIMCPEMSIETTPGQELLVALETDKRSLSSVASCVLLEVGTLLEDGGAVFTPIAAVVKIAPGGIVDRVMSWDSMNQALRGDDDGFLKLHLGPLLRFGPSLCDYVVVYCEVGP